MALTIAVTQLDDAGGTLRFSVTVEDAAGETRHDVTLAASDLSRLSRPGESGRAFVARCFAFLLEREPKESILRSFDVRVIGRYFPEFEASIRE